MKDRHPGGSQGPGFFLSHRGLLGFALLYPTYTPYALQWSLRAKRSNLSYEIAALSRQGVTPRNDRMRFPPFQGSALEREEIVARPSRP